EGWGMSKLIREYLDELTRCLALTPPIGPSALNTLYDRKDYPAMLGWIKNSMSLKLGVGLRIVDRPETSPPMWIELPEPMPAFGTLSEKWRLGYLTSTEALAASQYIAKIRYGWKSKVGSSGHRQSETGHRQSEDRQTERGIIAIFTGGAAILSIVMLPILFQGKDTDAARPQGVADSSVQANRTAPLQGANKLNPPPDDIVAAQNRLI